MDLFSLVGRIAIEGAAEANREVDGIKVNTSKLADHMDKAADKIAKWGTAILGAVASAGAAFGSLAYNYAAEFETSFAKVSTLLSGTSDELEKYKNKLLETSSEYNVSTDELCESVYQAISASVDQKDAIDFTTKALKLAKGGFTDTATAVDIMTTAINAYGMSAEEADHVSDALITTQNLGKTSVGELAATMGKAIPTAKSVGVSFDDLCSTFAVLTSNGIATAETSTYMSAMLNELGKEGTTAATAFREGTKHIKEGGLSMKEAMESGWDLTDVLSILDEQAYISGTSINNMFGSAEAGKSASILFEKSDKLNDIISQMGTSSGATQTAYEKMAGTMQASTESIKNEIKNTVTQVGQKLQPKVQKFLGFIEKKMPKIKKLIDKAGDAVGDALDRAEPVAEWLIEKALPKLIDILVFCVDNFEALAATIAIAVGALKTFSIITKVTTAIQGATGAFGTFSAVLSANPIGAVVTALGLLAGGIALVVASMQDEETQSEKNLRLAQEELQALKDENQAIQDNRDAIDEKATSDLAQIDRTEDLWKELQKLCDENGNVAESDKARADFILNELNEALGTEYEMTGNQIQNYKDLQSEIQNTIDMKKAEVLLTANEEKYTEAIKSKADAESLAADKLKEVQEQQKKVNELDKEYHELLSEYQATGYKPEGWDDFIDNLNNESEILGTLKEDYSTLNDRVTGYYTDIARYEEAATLMTQKKYNEAYEVMENYNKAYLRASDIAGKATEDQMKIMEQQVLDAGVKAGILNEQMQNCADSEKDMYQKMYDEAVEHFEDMKGELKKVGGEYTNELDLSIKGTISSVYRTAENAGLKTSEKFTDGMTSNQGALSNSLKTNGKTLGTLFSDGVSQGITEGQSKFKTSLGNFLNNGLSYLRGLAEIHSPSKLFAREIGQYIPSGVGEGVEDNEEAAIKPMKNLVDDMVVEGGNDSATLDARSIKPSDNVSAINDINIINKLEQVVSAINNMKIYLNDDTLVGAIAPAMDGELGNIYTGKARGR